MTESIATFALMPMQTAPIDGTHIDIWVNCQRIPNCSAETVGGQIVWVLNSVVYDSTNGFYFTQRKIDLTTITGEVYWSVIPTVREPGELERELHLLQICGKAQEYTANTLIELGNCRRELTQKPTDKAVGQRTIRSIQNYWESLLQQAQAFQDLQKYMDEALADANSTEEA